MITFNANQFLDEISNRIDADAHRIGQAVVKDAVQLAPKETGRLAGSISYAYDNQTHEIKFLVGAEYGLFVEYGTRYMAPRIYLRRAINLVGEIYGFHTEMEFANTIKTDSKLLAHGATFQMHRSLTLKQKRHVRGWLKPVSKFYHTSNVSRTKLTVKHKAP